MVRNNNRIITILAILLVCSCGTIFAQNKRQTTTRGACETALALNGVYRIDLDASDKLYSVIEGATSNVPYNEQQQFFMDLAVRLTPPDLLAIECRENRVSLGSSRSQRIDFVADGVMRSVRGKDGRAVRSRIAFERGSLIFTSAGGSDDNLNFSFTPIDNGRRLRVTRRISSRELIEPVVIQTVYNKTIDAARWDVFDNASVAGQTAKRHDEKTSPVKTAPRAISSSGIEGNKADAIREALNEWIAATNRHNIEKQMTFYLPELKAFYLARNTSRDAVRVEKTRAFAGANLIDIRAAEPEIIFQDGGRTAIMRFRKKYRVENKLKSRSGEVVQELRWQQTSGGWKIFSERDIKVIS
jgi:ketosteroid isomerase-like protein